MFKTEFVHRGEKYLVVQPYDHLLQSTFIKDVVERGDLFGVNLETRRFGIIPKRIVERHQLKIAQKPITVCGNDGEVYTGTVNENGEVRFFIQGNWCTYKNIYAFMERFK